MSTDLWLFVFAAIQALGVILTFFRLDVTVLSKLRLNAAGRPVSTRERVMVLLAIGALVSAGLGLALRVTGIEGHDDTINPENAGRIVRDWLDDPGLALSVRRRDAPDTSFIIDVTLHGRAMTITQSRTRNGYLYIGSNIDTSDTTRAALNNVPKPQLMEMLRTLHAQLALLGIEYRNLGPPFTGILIQITEPITPDLTKHSLILDINRCESGIAVDQGSV